jgi:hypothetical protein
MAVRPHPIRRRIDAGHAQFIDLRQHVMQTVAGFMEQRDDFIMREKRRLDLAIDRQPVR